MAQLKRFIIRFPEIVERNQMQRKVSRDLLDCGFDYTTGCGRIEYFEYRNRSIALVSDVYLMKDFGVRDYLLYIRCKLRAAINLYLRHQPIIVIAVDDLGTATVDKTGEWF